MDILESNKKIQGMPQYDFSPCDFHNLLFTKGNFFEEIVTFIDWLEHDSKGD